MTAKTTTTPVAEQILAQIEEAQAELVLDDDAILESPWLVVAIRPTGEAVLVERYRAEDEAIAGATQYQEAHGSQYDEINVTDLAAVGYPAALDTGGEDGTLEHTDDAGTPTLIDPAEYESEALSLAKVDGNAITRIALAFTGEIFLDRSDPEDVALYRTLVLGKGDIDLRVKAKCSGTGAKLATDKGGELDVVVGRKTLRIESVVVPAGER